MPPGLRGQMNMGTGPGGCGVCGQLQEAYPAERLSNLKWKKKYRRNRGERKKTNEMDPI